MATSAKPTSDQFSVGDAKFNGRQKGEHLGFGSSKTLRRNNKTQLTGHVFVSVDDGAVNSVCNRNHAQSAS